MTSLLEKTLRAHPRPYLTEGEMEALLQGTPDSRYGKVKRLLAQKKLLHIRRSLYSMTAEIGHPIQPHPFEIAQHLYGPSYISLESALAYHQLIPEAVYTITCASTKRSKNFITPLGVFSYSHLPMKDFYTEVKLIEEGEHRFFMAKPWKAICDYVYCYKKDWMSFEPLQFSLRVDLDALPTPTTNEIEILDDYYHHKRLSRFLKAIKKEAAV